MIDSNEGGMGVQSAVIRPERSRLFAAVAGLLVLTGLMAFFPSACVGLALLTPLLGCPLAGSGRQWAAWLAAAAPAALSLLYRFDPLYSLSLLLPGTLPMALTLWLKARKKLAAPLSIGLYIGAYAASLTLVMRSAQGLPKGWRSCSRPRWRHPISRACSCTALQRQACSPCRMATAAPCPCFCWTLGWCGRCCCLCG